MVANSNFLYPQNRYYGEVKPENGDRELGDITTKSLTIYACNNIIHFGFFCHLFQ